MQSLILVNMHGPIYLLTAATPELMIGKIKGQSILLFLITFTSFNYCRRVQLQPCSAIILQLLDASLLQHGCIK